MLCNTIFARMVVLDPILFIVSSCLQPEVCRSHMCFGGHFCRRGMEAGSAALAKMPFKYLINQCKTEFCKGRLFL